ncbi:hypothetical protein [Bacillus altitudinis]|uniref:hypothetical protein n=1 Tax=Bacillus altitudinis TaxID=293387 RepID=UPI002409F975|nr:hypothetical protein [Bacillus altitudinis]WEZ70317.1 hypothetical protein P5623_14110 [Bacillus altitudinis]
MMGKGWRHVKHTVQIEEAITELSLNWLVGDVRLYHHDHPYLLMKQTTQSRIPPSVFTASSSTGRQASHSR